MVCFTKWLNSDLFHSEDNNYHDPMLPTACNCWKPRAAEITPAARGFMMNVNYFNYFTLTLLFDSFSAHTLARTYLHMHTLIHTHWHLTV